MHVYCITFPFKIGSRLSGHPYYNDICKVFCFCAQYTFLMYRLERVVFPWQYTFLMYRLERVLSLCTVHISDISSGMCSLSVHSTHSWCPVMWYSLSNLLPCTEAKDLFCSHCFVVISPWRRQFHFLSKHVTAVRFLMTVADTKYPSYTHIRLRYDVVS
jgi:hypothetical protein